MGKVKDLIMQCEEEAYEILREKNKEEPTDQDVKTLAEGLFRDRVITLRAQGYGIPTRFMASLSRYSEQRIETGGFLRSVLENNLFEAMGRADDEAIAAFPAIVRYIFNELPGDCWGSKEKVKAWLNQGNIEATQ